MMRRPSHNSTTPPLRSIDAPSKFHPCASDFFAARDRRIFSTATSTLVIDRPRTTITSVSPRLSANHSWQYASATVLTSENFASYSLSFAAERVGCQRVLP